MSSKSNKRHEAPSSADNSRNVLFCFLLFAVSNGIISYSQVVTEIKLCVGFLGILIPFLYFLKKLKWEKPLSWSADADILKLNPAGEILGFVLLIGVLFRFYQLFDYHFWPSSDEALQGYFAIDLMKKWSWHFFYTSGQHPPLLIWLENALFRFSDSYYFNLRFCPALFSALTLLMGYWISRTFFSRAISSIFTLLLAFSYWPMLFGKFGVQGALVPFFEFLSIFLLGMFLKTIDYSRKRWLGVLLAFLLGVGSLTFTGWFSVVLVITLIISHELIFQSKKDLKSYFLFIAALLFSFLPWFLAVVYEGFGGYLIGISFLSGFFTGHQQIFTFISNFTSLFWGPVQTIVDYGPTWGGMLNPILGSLFFLGLLDLLLSRRQKTTKGLLTAFFVFLLPGFLSADHVEMFRIIPVMPIILFISTLGFLKLLVNFPKRTRVYLLLCLLVPSFGLDIYHLVRPELARKWTPIDLKSDSEDENYNAFQALKTISEYQGPGLIFTEFLLLPHGHTLKVASYAFNAADHIGMNPAEAKWAALVTNINYVPFLKKRFPESKWKGITPGEPQDGGLALGIIPITSGNHETFMEWLPIHQYFHELGFQSENMMNNPGTSEKFFAQLPEGYNLIKNDPYLESLFAEWCSQYHYKKGLEENIELIKRGIAKGYPSANLYFKLGNLYYFQQNFKQAREAYQMAESAPRNITASRAVIDYIDHLNTTTVGDFKPRSKRDQE